MSRSNIPEFSSIITEDNFEIITAEISLWRSVISQALYDLSLPPSNREYILWRRRAVNWLKEDNEDFLLVCEYANLPTKDILTHVNAITSLFISNNNTK